jgi:hypothetical protein
MRWQKPKDGDIKIKKKFALFPITIKKETRWLEWVTIKYIYNDVFIEKKDHYTAYYYRDSWIPIEFVNKDTI